MIEVRVQALDFDPGVELARLEALGGGAVASFIGLVRGDGGLSALELEYYPGMTERTMRAVAEEAMARWPLMGVVCVHRVGRLRPGERIVLAAVASAHRHVALDACAYLMDFLKTRATFWKREHYANGTARWVDARRSDEAAAARWAGQPAGCEPGGGAKAGDSRASAF